MPTQTNSQVMAQAAYDRIHQRPLDGEYTSFARGFPSLVHSCGLAQAIAFAQAKGKVHGEYLEDLAAVLQAVGHSEAGSSKALGEASRTSTVPTYIRLSRHTLQAADWLKRYVDAVPPVRG